MFRGKLISIYITENKQAELRPVQQARAVRGLGLEGDRYYLRQGTFTKPGPDREVTLIEIESLEALANQHNIELAPGQARRNLVTRGVPLNHLVGKNFKVGDVLLRGLRLCEPCAHLESLTAAGVKEALLHRGGLRAQIIEEGMLRVGDEVSESEASD